MSCCCITQETLNYVSPCGKSVAPCGHVQIIPCGTCAYKALSAQYGGTGTSIPESAGGIGATMQTSLLGCVYSEACKLKTDLTPSWTTWLIILGVGLAAVFVYAFAKSR